MYQDVSSKNALINKYLKKIAEQAEIEKPLSMHITRHSFAQLMTYLRILDDKVRKPHENPSIGIVLYKNANKDFVEYVIQDYAKPMGMATYRLSKDMPDKLREALPDVEELKKLL